MRYNATKTPRKPDTRSYEGGASFKLDPKLELLSILSTGFGNTFYEKLSDRETRLQELIKTISKKDPLFVAKALVYTRSVTGQRSATHFGSVALAPYLSGKSFSKNFFSKRDRKENKGGVIYRLDDMLEIMACYQHFNPGKPLPNAMKKGFRDALENADSYELAKYQGKNKSVSLVDIVNLVHPSPSKDMQKVFSDLMKGRLKQFNTVEDKNTSVGKEVAQKVKSGKITKEEAKIELKEKKEANYGQLIMEGKIGYLALLRNLRNLLKNSTNTEIINEACNMLTDEKRVRKSLVFPHQIDLALEMMLLEGGYTVPRKVLEALDKAYNLAVPNLTELFPYGKTAVVFDSSASMGGGYYSNVKVNGKNINKSPVEKAALMAATLGKGIDADIYHFASSCEQIKYNPLDSINTIKNKCKNMVSRVGHGTSFDSIFQTLGNRYDRVFIISDLQGNSYLSKHKYGRMHIYSIDLCGYGTTMFKPGEKVYQLFGYSAETYELIKRVEVDAKALLKEVEAIKL